MCHCLQLVAISIWHTPSSHKLRFSIDSFTKVGAGCCSSSNFENEMKITHRVLLGCKQFVGLNNTYVLSCCMFECLCSTCYAQLCVRGISLSFLPLSLYRQISSAFNVHYVVINSFCFIISIQLLKEKSHFNCVPEDATSF